MGTRIGVVASEKGAAKECDVGLGLRMQTTNNNNNDNKSFSRKKMMTMMMEMPHHDDDEPPLLCNSNGGFGTTGDEENDTGPSLFCNTSNNNNQVASMAHIYDVVGADSGSLLPKTLLFPNSETFSFNSSGVMVNANVRFAFTAAQRREFERQTMIYKYMMASAPVPPQLLIPITKTPSNFAHLHSNRSLELGISNSSDPEPWRCRRTDGKKWRCSRNVVPDQKYCERHSHKSRPRSRKPVELHSHFFNNNNTRTPYSKSDFLHQRENHQSPFSGTVASNAASSHEQPRSLEGFMEREEWHQIMHTKQQGLRTDVVSAERNTNVDVPKQQNDRALNLYNNEGLQQTQGLNDQFSLLIDPELTHLGGGGGALDSSHTNQTRHFIDAWSTAERDHRMGEMGSRYCVPSSNDKLPFSSLTLSMHGGNGSNSEESPNGQMGFGGVMGSVRESDGDEKSQWLSPVSWTGSPPGGPLAEALCLGMAGSTRPASSRSSS